MYPPYHAPIRRSVEGLAFPVGSQDSAVAVIYPIRVATRRSQLAVLETFVQLEYNAPIVQLTPGDNRGLAVAGEYGLRGEMHCGQAGAARRVHRDRRSAQVKMVRYTVRNHVWRLSKWGQCLVVVLDM